MQPDKKVFPVDRCLACYIVGIIFVAVTMLVVAGMVFFELISGCHGKSGCGILFAFAPIVISWFLIPLGIMSTLFRVAFFRSAGKLVPMEYVKKLRIGQWLLLTPWAGILLAFVISIFGFMIM